MSLASRLANVDAKVGLRKPVTAPPEWQPSWGQAVPVLRAARFRLPAAVLGAVLSYVVGALVGAAREPLEVAFTTVIAIPAYFALSSALGRTGQRRLRVRQLVACPDLSPVRDSAALAWLGAGVGLGALALVAPTVSALISLLIVQLGRQRLLVRRLEKATGGTVVRRAHHPVRGRHTRHSGLYLTPVGAPQFAVAPVARPASPYARLRP